MLSNNIVLLNGDAIFTLFRMGLGKLLGVKAADWVASDSGIPSYEQVIDGRLYAGLRDARLTAQALTGDYLKIEYEADVAVHTEVRNPAGIRSGPGMAVAAHRLIMLPYGRGSDYQGLRHPVRQSLLQTLLSDLAGKQCPVFLRDTANVAVYACELSGKKVLLLVNASLDDYAELQLRCLNADAYKATEISSQGTSALRDNLRGEGDHLVLTSDLKRLEVKALVFNAGRWAGD